jgi:hypothetical protein
VDTSRRAGLTAGEGRRFGLTVGIAFLVLAGVFLWRDRSTVAGVLGATGAILVLAGLAVPRRLGPVRHAWMTLAHLLSRVTTPIFLGIMYFLVITPIGLLVRASGKNPLHRRESDGGFWLRRPESARRSDLKRQF